MIPVLQTIRMKTTKICYCCGVYLEMHLIETSVSTGPADVKCMAAQASKHRHSSYPSVQ